MHSPASFRLLHWVLISGIASIVVLVLGWQNREHFGVVISHFRQTPSPLPRPYRSGQIPACRSLEGGDDVLVVMKTGATELDDKLMVHLRTTLTCYPHYIIFSDYEEDLDNGQHIYDALKYINPEILETNDDFELWRKLRDNGGRDALRPSDRSGTDSRYKDESIRMQIPGWKLDKWKFLPVMNQTLHHDPDRHWYVFVETDTYMLWSSLLWFLAGQSWTQDQYLGSHSGIGDVRFAHGGSGFVLSRSALEKVVKLYNDDKDQWEAMTDSDYWVGDHLLAAALRQQGVYMQDAEPDFQGEPVGLVDHSPDKGAWCQTAITFHHQSPSDIEELWHFEQAWISSNAARDQTNPKEPQRLRHRDMFEGYIMPRMSQARINWNNTADFVWQEHVETLSDCRQACEQYSECVQYARNDNGQCWIKNVPTYGESYEGVESGWIWRKVQQYFDTRDSCS